MTSYWEWDSFGCPHTATGDPMMDQLISQDSANKLFQAVQEKGFLTGSRRFGLSDGSVESNFNYEVMDYHVEDFIWLDSLENGPRPHTLSASLIRIENEKLTHRVKILICIKHYEYKELEQVTMMFEGMLKNYQPLRAYCRRKETRVAIFQALLDHKDSLHQ